MILKRTISKEEVKEMPKAAFPGRIHVIQTESEAQKAVAYLQSQAILGIDSETRPSAFRIRACKRYTVSCLVRKSQNHSVFLIGKQMY